MEKMNLTFYKSSLIQEMLFDSEEDAKTFDIALTDYLNDNNAVNEFKSAMSKYSSLYAIEYAINNDTFHFNLGEYSDNLILASENMADGCNGVSIDDCYKLPLMFILNKIRYGY